LVQLLSNGYGELLLDISILPQTCEELSCFYKEKARIYAVCGVSQTPIYQKEREEMEDAK